MNVLEDLCMFVGVVVLGIAFCMLASIVIIDLGFLAYYVVSLL